MVVNIRKTKYIMFHNKGKSVDMDGKGVVYDDHEPLGADPHLFVPLELERYHSNHENPECRAYKLLVSQSTLVLITRVVEEDDRQSENITLIDKVHLTPLRKPLF
jgi:hypothetical protein